MKILLPTLLLSVACGSSVAPTPTTAAPSGRADPRPAPTLEVVADSAAKWTGVTIGEGGTLFVNYPRWSEDVPVSVARLADGAPEPFPDAAWNSWAPGDATDERWVCVQSVVMDGHNRLWALDTGNPRFGGVVEGAPKLVRFDLPSREVAQVIHFAAPAITASSYLNDVRFDLERNVAFITDSGEGAILVVDLNSGESRRVLDEHPSTHAEDIVLSIQGRSFDKPVHSDGIAYDAQGDQLYFQALRARTLYRVPGGALRDAELTADGLAAQVERVAESGAADGLLFHRGHIFVSALEQEAILAVSPDGSFETVVSDPRIAWPDTFTARPGASEIYFSTAQLHLDAPSDPYRIWRLRLE